MATISQARSWTPPSRAASAMLTLSGTKGSKNQRRSGRVSFSSNSRRTARIFLRSVFRFSPSIAAALIWLPRVAARASPSQAATSPAASPIQAKVRATVQVSRS